MSGGSPLRLLAPDIGQRDFELEVAHCVRGVLSPLLANIALHVLDQTWAAGGRHLGVLVRYADDFVVLCPTRQRAEQSRDRAAAVLSPLGLRLHPDKTRIADLTRGAEGFDFLGFHNHLRPGRRTKCWYLHQWPSTRAMTSIRSKVRSMTTNNFTSLPLEVVVAQPRTSGLGGVLPTRQLVGSVRLHRQLCEPAAGDARQPQARLARLELDHPVQPPVGQQPRHLPPYRHGALRNCACLTMNGVGEPCAGEPHARFDRGPLAKRNKPAGAAGLGSVRCETPP